MTGESLTALPALWQPLKFSGEHWLCAWQLCFLALAHLLLFTRRAHPESYQLPITSVAVACADIKQGCQGGCGVIADPGVSPWNPAGVAGFAGELWSHLLPTAPFVWLGSSLSCCQVTVQPLPVAVPAINCGGFYCQGASAHVGTNRRNFVKTLNQTATVSLFPVYWGYTWSCLLPVLV